MNYSHNEAINLLYQGIDFEDDFYGEFADFEQLDRFMDQLGFRYDSLSGFYVRK